MSLVSVITVSYNTGRFIEDNILSVENQDYHSVEHIVVDGGSTDLTVEILKKHKTVRWVSEPDKGVSDAFNKGIKMAWGDILAFLNADDIYYRPDAISKAVEAMKANPEVGVIFGDCAFIDADGKGVGFFQGQGQRFNFPSLLCSEFTIPLASAFIRRSVIEAIGGKLDASLNFVADWELWIRIGLRLPIVYVPEMFSGVREYAGAAQTTLRCAISHPVQRRLILDSVFRTPNLSAELKSLQKRAYAGTYIVEAILFLNSGHKTKAMGCIFTAIRVYPFCLLVYSRYLWGRRFYRFLFKVILSCIKKKAQ